MTIELLAVAIPLIIAFALAKPMGHYIASTVFQMRDLKSR